MAKADEAEAQRIAQAQRDEEQAQAQRDEEQAQADSSADPIATPMGSTVPGDSIAVDDGADAASAITYSDNPDKPDPSTVAQVEDPHTDGVFEGDLAPAGESNLDQ